MVQFSWTNLKAARGETILSLTSIRVVRRQTGISADADANSSTGLHSIERIFIFCPKSAEKTHPSKINRIKPGKKYFFLFPHFPTGFIAGSRR